MAARIAPAVTAAAVLATTASVAQAGGPPRLDLAARTVSDSFVRALVVRHDLAGARRYASPRFADLRKLSAGFVRDGVDAVVGPSRIVRACRTRPSERDSARGDCVLYHLRGRHRVQGTEQRTDGAFEVWLRREAGAWKVWAYDYTASVTVCPGRCPEDDRTDDGPAPAATADPSP